MLICMSMSARDSARTSGNRWPSSGPRVQPFVDCMLRGTLWGQLSRDEDPGNEALIRNSRSSPTGCNHALFQQVRILNSIADIEAEIELANKAMPG